MGGIALEFKVVLLSEERAKRSETRMPINTVSIQHYLEVLANAIK